MDNEVISALPTGGPADAALLRNFLIKRVIYTFTPDEDPSTFDALDSDTGAIPQALGFNGSVFWLDPNDSTSAHDGVSVIKTADDYRYKVAGNYDFKAVLNVTTTVPPTSPALGDKYIVAAGATGAWSSHQDDLTVWTENGWKFQIPSIGQWVLDEDVGGFISYTSTGWVYGPGARSFDAASIPFSAALGWGAKFEVENQTTTTPPTATKGLRYVVGASATGAWSGKDKQIAICEVAGTWTFYSPSAGWTLYDKALKSAFTWDGTAWLSTAGTWIDRKATALTASGSTTAPTGSTYYTFSGTAPTTSHRRLIDAVTASFSAKKNSANLRVHYYGDVSFVSAGATTISNPFVIALYRDSGSNAVAWQAITSVNTLFSLAGSNPLTVVAHLDHWFELDAPDTSSHTYTIAILSPSSALDASLLVNRRLEIEEAA